MWGSRGPQLSSPSSKLRIKGPASEQEAADRCLGRDWSCALREQRVVNSVRTTFAQDAPPLESGSGGSAPDPPPSAQACWPDYEAPGDDPAKSTRSKRYAPACRTRNRTVEGATPTRPVTSWTARPRRTAATIADDMLQHGFLPMLVGFSVGGLSCYGSRPLCLTFAETWLLRGDREQRTHATGESGCRFLFL